MIKRFAVFLVATAAAGMFIGCDTGDGTARLWMKGDAGIGSKSFDVSGEVLFDVAAGTTGGDTGGPYAILATASSSCAFDLKDKDNVTIGDGSIQIVTAANWTVAKALCDDDNNCIFCTMTDGANCTIVCNGVVVSDDLTEGEYFDIYLTATHMFNTEMEADGQGMIRIDGYVDDGTEADLGNTLVTLQNQDFIQTSCNSAEAVLVEDESNTTLTGLTVGGIAYDADPTDGEYHEYYEITTSAASEGNPKSCVVQDKLTLRLTLPVSVSPDDEINLSFAQTKTIKNYASICESQDVCDLH